MKKIGVIGVGKMGLSHLAIANSTLGLEVVAVCDSSKMLLRTIGKNTGKAGYSDYRKMLSSHTLDGVIISVPSALHYDIAMQCIEQRINIFIEKPLTLNYEDSLKLCSLAEECGVFGQVGYVNRYNPIFQHLTRLIDEAVIGEILNYEARMAGGVVIKPSKKGWRNDYGKGGGCLYDYGSHCIDLAVYFFGEAVSVQSAVLKNIYSSSVDDLLLAILRHDEGYCGSIHVNWSDKSLRKAGNHLEVLGTSGKILANKQEIKIFVDKDNEYHKLHKGWNEIYITDLDTCVGYYLRGEDFSRQMEAFSARLNDSVSPVVSSLATAAVTDRLIAEMFAMSRGSK
jgi:predicted dehydrogenase